MGLRINTNVAGFNAQRSLASTGNQLGKSMERLSSGLRINNAGDDAAGLGISEMLKAQIRSLDQANRNAQDGVSLMQYADGSMGEIQSILQRVRELAVQYNNGTIDASGQAAITAEVAQLSAEVTRIIGASDFNGVNLLESGSAVSILVGPNAADTISVTRANVASAIGTAISGFAGGTADLSAIDTAIQNVSTQRATFGAMQNRLDHASVHLAVATENMMAAQSRIRDVDVAQETTNFARLQILQNAGVAVLAQANQLNRSSVMRLLE